MLPDGTHVNHELVKDGWCWWYREYVSDNTSNATRENVVIRLPFLQTASVSEALCISHTHL